jgi:hypothetical protein
MSDRDDLDTLDLDLAFDRLCAYVEAHTRARGAERAIRSANHRRLAAAGGALATAVVLAGILLGSLGLPFNQSAPPVATPMSDPLPEPKIFDATAFNEAADGWTSGWTAGASPVPTDLPCVPYDGDVPEPLDSSTTEFRAGTRVGATHTVERFDTSERASDSFVKQTFEESCRGEGIQLPDEIWNGGQSIGFGIKTGRQTIYEIGIVHETELAVLQVAGAGEMSEDVRKQLVSALLADLRT